MLFFDESPVRLGLTPSHHIGLEVIEDAIQLLHLFHASEDAQAIELAQKKPDAVIWFQFWNVAVLAILHVSANEFSYPLTRC